MRLFSISILPFILAFSLPVTTGCGADTQQSPSVRQVRQVRQADSLWTRKLGTDWQRMLGPNYDSRSPEVGILTKWPTAGLKVVWTADTGVSYGNGVAASGRWFQFDRFGDVERLSCLNAETGEKLWKWESPVQYRDSYGYNNGPRCSPVVDGDRVYVLGVAGTLACLSVADGTQLWKLNTSQKYNVIQNFFGVGASPLIYKDKILVMIGGSPSSVSITKSTGSAMVAFDKVSGIELYRVGDYLASYSAPIIHKINGADVCLAFVREGLLAFDPETGSNESFFPWRADDLESVNAASPVGWNDRILLSETYARGSVLLKLTNKGLVELWKDGTGRKEQILRSHWSTPLLDGNVIYASSGRNEPDTDLRCLELKVPANETESWKPDVRWTIRNHDRMTGLIVDKHLLMLGEYGTLQLIELNKDKLTVIAQMDLAQTKDARDGRPLIQTPSWAPPVLSHGLLYVRGTDKVVCLELIPE